MHAGRSVARDEPVLVSAQNRAEVRVDHGIRDSSIVLIQG